MAKKARRRAEEEAEPAFEFPTFDERGFLQHEYEQYYATLLAFVFGVVIGAVAYAVGTVIANVGAPLLVGSVATAGCAYAIRELRPASREYTKGDWASLILVMFFGFLGFWFLFANVLPR